VSDAPTTFADPSCVHCGFCLPVCPTSAQLGTELDSPRGRLVLMDAVASGEVAPDDALVRHLDLCLGCQACESACPSGVSYAQKLEDTREALLDAPRPWRERIVTRLLVRGMAAPPWLSTLGLSVGRRLAAARHGLITPFALPSWVRSGLALLDNLPASMPSPPALIPARGRQRARVGLLLGCLARHAFAGTHRAAARVLAEAGCEVIVPPGQGCCGALAAHGGERDFARAQARKLIASFESVGPLDAILVDAAGCGSAMKHYGDLLAEDDLWRERAADFSARTRDVLEWLHELGAPPARRSLDVRVAYHEACHLHHAQGVTDAPAALLTALPGVQLTPLQGANLCCGSAGIYNLVHPEVAGPLGEQAVDRLLAGDPDVIAAANPGCLMQLATSAAERGRPLPVKHPIELLAEACCDVE
jgi:glycolate oxidase iron-sulfur subunit